MTRLGPSEREAILSIADDEHAWHIFTDSAHLTRRLLAVAARWGAVPERLSVGYDFTLPLQAVRFVGPQRVTAKEQARRDRLREAAQNARHGAKSPIAVGRSEVSPGSRVS